MPGWCYVSPESLQRHDRVLKTTFINCVVKYYLVKSFSTVMFFFCLFFLKQGRFHSYDSFCNGP